MDHFNFQTPSDALQHAASLVPQGNALKVGEALEAGLKQFPDSVELLSHLSFYYYKTGQYSRAAQTLLRRNEFAEPDQSICFLLAQVYEAQRNYAQAHRWYLSAGTRGDFSPRLFIKQVKTSFLPRLDDWLLFIRNHAAFRALLQSVKSIQNLKNRWGVRLVEIVSPSLIDESYTEQPFRFSHFLSFLQRYDLPFLQNVLAYHKNREIVLTSLHLPKKKDARILDIGTGNNPLPLYWSALGYPSVALDGSLYGYGNLRQVEGKLREDGHSPPFYLTAGDALELPFRDHSFDYVTAICAIEHIPEDGDVACMREVYRVLKPGGRAVITVETCGTFFENWMEVPYERGYQTNERDDEGETPEWFHVFCRNYTVKEMRSRLCGSADWKEVELGFYDDFNLPVRAWMDPVHHSILPRLLHPFTPLLSLLFYRKRAFSKELTSSSIGYVILER